MTTATLKPSANSWTLRLFTLLIWLLVGLCAAYWAFKFTTTKTVEATTAQSAASVVVDSKAIGKLLGATYNVAVKVLNTPASTKFSLFGLANSAGGQGYALIALDGKPAKPYRVGSLVADDLLLKSISKTGVILAASLKSPDGVTLELPERKAVQPTNPITPPLARFPALQPNVQPNMPPPIVNPAGSSPAFTASSAFTPSMPLPLVKPSGATPTAPPISRFAPANVDGSMSSPNLAMPAAATSSSVGER